MFVCLTSWLQSRFIAGVGTFKKKKLMMTGSGERESRLPVHLRLISILLVAIATSG
jgi:hypothetical protein